MQLIQYSSKNVQNAMLYCKTADLYYHHILKMIQCIKMYWKKKIRVHLYANRLDIHSIGQNRAISGHLRIDLIE